VDTNIDPKKTTVFFRGYSPSHFRYKKKKEEKRKHFICLMITLDIGLYIILLVSCATGVESGTLVVSVVRQNQ
jgi:hypothetical protein